MTGKLLSLLVVLALALSLAACGAAKPEAPAAPVQPEAVEPAAEPAPEPVTEPVPEAEEPAAAADEIALAFLFKNKTGRTMQEAYLYPAGAEDHGENLLTEAWPNNTEKSQYLPIIIARPETDSYEITLVDAEGTVVVFTDLNLKFMNSVSLKEDGSISLKYDSAKTFSEEDLVAAGLTVGFAKVEVDESEQVTLAFLFKNKTGKDAEAIYIYPTGADDHGENILTEVWPNNMTEDDYLWISVERSAADVYDLLVLFTDGSSFTYTNEDLRSNNSASMKDGAGKLSLKVDDAIGPDGKPIAEADGVSADAEVVILRFVFKNKTGLDACEAYVYPMGAEDHGENILTETWVNNEDSWQYLHPELERARADAYEITVVFTDGTTLVYSDIDLLTNNSVSLRDAAGACSVKFADDEPVTSAK